jgi:hypothetical protein
MKLWSLFFLLTAGLLAPPSVSTTTDSALLPSLARTTPLWGGAEFLAMSACAEFPSQPALLEPTRDTGRDAVGDGGPPADMGQDPLPDDGGDAVDPEDDVAAHDEPDSGGLPDDALVGDLDADQAQTFCERLETRVGVPAPALQCEGRAVWPTAVSCPVTLERLGECGVTVGDYDECLTLAEGNPCSLLYAPICEDIHRCLGTGLDPGLSIGALPADDYNRMCRWGVEGLGENREFFCDGIIRVNTHSVQDCEEHDRAACEVTVREYEACTTHIQEDICEVLNAPVCAAFRDCFGPKL